MFASEPKRLTESDLLCEVKRKLDLIRSSSGVFRQLPRWGVAKIPKEKRQVKNNWAEPPLQSVFGEDENNKIILSLDDSLPLPIDSGHEVFKFPIRSILSVCGVNNKKKILTYTLHKAEREGEVAHLSSPLVPVPCQYPTARPSQHPAASGLWGAQPAGLSGPVIPNRWGMSRDAGADKEAWAWRTDAQCQDLISLSPAGLL